MKSFILFAVVILFFSTAHASDIYSTNLSDFDAFKGTTWRLTEDHSTDPPMIVYFADNANMHPTEAIAQLSFSTSRGWSSSLAFITDGPGHMEDLFDLPYPHYAAQYTEGDFFESYRFKFTSANKVQGSFTVLQWSTQHISGPYSFTGTREGAVADPEPEEDGSSSGSSSSGGCFIVTIR